MTIHIYDPVLEAYLYTFNKADNKGYITGKVEGLGPPPVRTSHGSYAGRSGGYSGQSLWDPRLVTISGMLIADTVNEMHTHRLYFSDVCARLDKFYLLINYDETGVQYLIYCRMDGTPMLDYVPLDPLRAPFSFSMIADDPVIYDNTSQSTITVALSKTVGGGVTWPLTWPLTWSAGAGSTTVSNDGKVPIKPVITLTGSMTSPTLSNETTGEFISLPGFTAPAGSEVIVDLYNESVTLNGGNIAGLLGTGFSWWHLQEGQNTIKLTTSDAADTVTGEMEWRNGVMGI